MPTCTACRSQNLREADGLFYCEECGTQNTMMRETESEFIGNARLRITEKNERDEEGKLKRKTAAKQVGRRLSTATYLLTRIAYRLHLDFGVPEDVVDKSIFIYQSYLRAVGVAFSEDEVATSEGKFLVLTKKTKLQMAKEIANLNKRKKQQEQREAEIQNLSQWELSAMDPAELTLEEGLQELQVDEVHQLETDLSRDAVVMAARLYLGLDLLLNVVFLGCHAVGWRSILVSDLHRWHREDRFHVQSHHLLNLNPALDPKPHGEVQNLKMRDWKFYFGVDNLHGLYTSLSFLVQVVAIPPVVCLPSTETLLRRFLFDLNLPVDFWPRVEIVLRFLPPPLAEFTPRALGEMRRARQGDELKQTILELQRSGRHAFLRSYFKSPVEGAESKKNESRFDRLVCVPHETKAVAMILLALKLAFALDDKTEDELVAANEGEGAFDFGRWLHQLTFRNLLRRGVTLEHVLSPKFTLSTYYDQKIPQHLHHHGVFNNRRNLSTVLPPHSHTPHDQKPLVHCFPLDRTKLPTDVFESNLAKYAPIRAHGTFGRDIGDEEEKHVDAERLATLHREFNKEHLDYKHLPEGLPELKDEEDASWRKMFPCFPKYRMTPLDRKMSMWKNGIPCLPMIFFRFRYRDERAYLSRSFDRLLFQLASMIGESVDVLFFCFLFAEYHFFYKLRNPREVTSQSDFHWDSITGNVRASTEELLSSDESQTDEKETAEDEEEPARSPWKSRGRSGKKRKPTRRRARRTKSKRKSVSRRCA
ncbi:hypothetical protein M3Y99_00091000 [Aphelenchoides fujianensis]|nr:hypothetical protein M3Y99_00091000 [Aphelenchoides fujianensis]